MTALTPFAVSAAPLLRAIAAEHPSPSATAEAAGRNPKHFARDVAALEREGLVTRRTGAVQHFPMLTDEGVAMLAALDRAAAPPAPDGFTVLRHDQIAPDPDNPRKTFDEEALDELAAEIVSRGALLQNLVVRPLVLGFGVHMLVAGERRWRAIGRAIERGDLPFDWAIPVKIEPLDDAAARVAAIVENGQRVDVPPLEEAQAFQRLVDLDEHTPSSIAAIIGKTPRHVQLRLALLKLDGESQADLAEGRISLAQARQMATEPKKDVQGPARQLEPTPSGAQGVPAASAPPSPPAFEIVKANRDERQAQVGAWCARCFGDAHAASLPQRGVRLLEEAIELAQAAGVERDMAARLVGYVYARDVGEIAQEIGGVSVTLLAFAHAAGLSANGEEVREVSRVLAKPASWFTDRNAMKNASGFDALAYPSGAAS